MSATRHFRIPPTRLPFVNAEVACVPFAGTPHLVSSIYGGGSGGRLYFWNPDTGAHAMRELPDGVAGAYMLKAGPDGLLYLGCGNGDLRRYDGEADRFETLVTGELSGLCWGGIVLGPHVLWNASRGGKVGAIAAYNIDEDQLEGILAPADDHIPPAGYGHRAAPTPDGKALWCVNTPGARLIVVEPDASQAQAHTPPCLEGCTWSNAAFLDPETVAVFAGATELGARLHLLSYPTLESIEELPLPVDHNLQHKDPLVLGGCLYLMDDESGNLWRMDLSSHRWQVAVENWSNGTYATAAVWQGRDICAVTVFGETLRYCPETGGTDGFDLEAVGDLGAHAVCAVPEEGLILGAPFINQRFWTIDMATGEGRDQGRAAPGVGQVNQIVWDAESRRALLSSYTTASVTVFDPGRPAAWPENPRTMASAQHAGQMRPMALAHDGRHVWMATSPAYGTLGGALCRLDPRTGEMDVWHQIVPDQKVNALAVDPDRRRVFFSTDIYADCGSIPPTQTTAQIAAFDMDELRIMAQRPVEEGAPVAWGGGVLPDGRALFHHGPDLLAWDLDEDGLTRYAATPDGMAGLICTPGGLVICATAETIGVLAPSGDGHVYQGRLPQPGARFLHVAGGALYYAVGYEVFETPLSELGE